jgi:hypothetical protein
MGNRPRKIAIFNGSISNILLENGESLKNEQIAIHQVGLKTDTTASRFNGVNYNTPVFDNEA